MTDRQELACASTMLPDGMQIGSSRRARMKSSGRRARNCPEFGVITRNVV
jgi:hypothetical protein